MWKIKGKGIEKFKNRRIWIKAQTTSRCLIIKLDLKLGDLRAFAVQRMSSLPSFTLRARILSGHDFRFISNKPTIKFVKDRQEADSGFLIGVCGVILYLIDKLYFAIARRNKTGVGTLF